jgi:hypothetical protein
MWPDLPGRWFRPGAAPGRSPSPTELSGFFTRARDPSGLSERRDEKWDMDT